MSGSPPPIWGEAIGMAKCVSKSPVENGRMVVTFITSVNSGTIVQTFLEAEANYFQIGESYPVTLSKGETKGEGRDAR